MLSTENPSTLPDVPKREAPSADQRLADELAARVRRRALELDYDLAAGPGPSGTEGKKRRPHFAADAGVPKGWLNAIVTGGRAQQARALEHYVKVARRLGRTAEWLVGLAVDGEGLSPVATIAQSVQRLEGAVLELSMAAAAQKHNEQAIAKVLSALHGLVEDVERLTIRPVSR